MAKAVKKYNHETNARALLALLVVLLALGILLLFNSYRDNIILSGAFKQFMTLSAVGAGLLLGLLFLTNKEPSGKRKKSR